MSQAFDGESRADLKVTAWCRVAILVLRVEKTCGDGMVRVTKGEKDKD